MDEEPFVLAALIRMPPRRRVRLEIVWMDRAVFYHLADAETSGDLNAQFEAAREWCRRAGFELAGYYVDLGLSGTTAFSDRPAAVELMREAPAAAAKWVLVTDWRRVAMNAAVGRETARILEQVGLRVQNMETR